MKDKAEQERTKAKKAEVLKNLEIARGNIKKACKKTKIARKTFYKWKKEDEKFKAEIEAIQYIEREDLGDLILDKWRTKINAGYWPAISKGIDKVLSDRGYNERKELTGANGDPLFPENAEIVIKVGKEMPPVESEEQAEKIQYMEEKEIRKKIKKKNE